MLYVVDVREDKRHLIPAVTHVDGTGRLQTVHQGVSPRYYQLIDTFGKATGVPIILNTSFNLQRRADRQYASRSLQHLQPQWHGCAGPGGPCDRKD